MCDELDRSPSEGFRSVMHMRGSMPRDESVLLLMGKAAVDKASYGR